MVESAPDPKNNPLRAGGIVRSLRLAMIRIMSMPDKPGIAGAVLGSLARQDINLQLVVESTDANNRSHIVVCVDEADLEAALVAIYEVSAKVEAETVIHRRNIALVSIFGPHFREKPGSACLCCASIAKAGVNILGISTSFSSITCLVEASEIDLAVSALKKAFEVPDSAVCTSADGLSRRAKPGK